MLVPNVEITQMVENQLRLQAHWASKIHQAAPSAQPAQVAPELRVLADRGVPYLENLAIDYLRRLLMLCGSRTMVRSSPGNGATTIQQPKGRKHKSFTKQHRL